MPQTPESARKSELGGQIKDPLETIPRTRREARRPEATAPQKQLTEATNPEDLMIDIRLGAELCPFQEFVCLSSCPYYIKTRLFEGKIIKASFIYDLK